MSNNTRQDDAASVPSQGSTRPSTISHVQPGSSSQWDHNLNTPTMSNEEVKAFRKIFERALLPAITKILGEHNIGGQVLFHRRRSISVVTRGEMPSDLKQQIQHAVSADLPRHLGTKISLEFSVGEVIRTGH